MTSDCAVLATTLRAMKLHGRDLLNDKQTELDLGGRKAREADANHCRDSDNWAQGGRGAVELAESVVETSGSSPFSLSNQLAL